MRFWIGLFIGLLFALSAGHAFAAANSKKKGFTYFDVGLYQSEFQDIKTNNSTAGENIDPMLTTEVLLRLKSFFSLGATYGQTADGTNQMMGVGLHIDTPGYFFIGGNIAREAQFNRKRHHFNTALFGYLVTRTGEDIDGSTIRQAGSNVGASFDTFFTDYVYLTLKASVVSIQSNSFFSFSYGLGIEF